MNVAGKKETNFYHECGFGYIHKVKATRRGVNARSVRNYEGIFPISKLLISAKFIVKYDIHLSVSIKVLATYKVTAVCYGRVNKRLNYWLLI